VEFSCIFKLKRHHYFTLDAPDAHGRRADSGVALFGEQGAVNFERSKHSAKIERACQEDSRLIRSACADSFKRGSHNFSVASNPAPCRGRIA
jgi:hypothetical protein